MFAFVVVSVFMYARVANCAFQFQFESWQCLQRAHVAKWFCQAPLPPAQKQQQQRKLCIQLYTHMLCARKKIWNKTHRTRKRKTFFFSFGFASEFSVSSFDEQHHIRVNNKEKQASYKIVVYFCFEFIFASYRMHMKCARDSCSWFNILFIYRILLLLLLL